MAVLAMRSDTGVPRNEKNGPRGPSHIISVVPNPVVGGHPGGAAVEGNDIGGIDGGAQVTPQRLPPAMRPSCVQLEVDPVRGGQSIVTANARFDHAHRSVKLDQARDLAGLADQAPETPGGRPQASSGWGLHTVRAKDQYKGQGSLSSHGCILRWRWPEDWQQRSAPDKDHARREGRDHAMRTPCPPSHWKPGKAAEKSHGGQPRRPQGRRGSGRDQGHRHLATPDEFTRSGRRSPRGVGSRSIPRSRGARGVVLEVGEGVTTLKPAIMSSRSIPTECRQCPSCLSGHRRTSCTAIRKHPGAGPDGRTGTTRFSMLDGTPIYHYMGALGPSPIPHGDATEIALAQVCARTRPSTRICYIGCGVTHRHRRGDQTPQVSRSDRPLPVFGLGRPNLLKRGGGPQER